MKDSTAYIFMLPNSFWYEDDTHIEKKKYSWEAQN